MIEVLANTVVVIILQYITAWNQHMYALNLHNVIYQLYLKKKKPQILNKQVGFVVFHTY